MRTRTKKKTNIQINTKTNTKRNKKTNTKTNTKKTTKTRMKRAVWPTLPFVGLYLSCVSMQMPYNCLFKLLFSGYLWHSMITFTSLHAKRLFVVVKNQLNVEIYIFNNKKITVATQFLFHFQHFADLHIFKSGTISS